MWRAAFALLPLVACSAPHSMAPAVAEGDAGEVVLLAFPSDGGGALAWDGWAGAFVNDYCVQCHSPTAPCFGSGCHTPGDPRTPDFEDKTTVVGDTPLIRCGICVAQSPAWSCPGGTAAKEFPVPNGQNPLPTDEQRDLVVDWIDAGCP